MLGRVAGEALWPAAFPLPALQRIQANTLARVWSALYQANPVPDEGELFSPDKLGLASRTDDVVVWVRAWDLAGSKDGDWTVGVLMGRTKDKRYLVANVVRFRGRPDEVEDRIFETARFDTRKVKISMPRDPGQAGLAQELHLTKLLAGFNVAFSPESGDKETRAEPYAAQVNHGLVSMFAAEWNAAYREELRAFPYGKNDDQVDASSRAFMALLETSAPMKISKELLARRAAGLASPSFGPPMSSGRLARINAALAALVSADMPQRNAIGDASPETRTLALPDAIVPTAPRRRTGVRQGRSGAVVVGRHRAGIVPNRKGRHGETLISPRPTQPSVPFINLVGRRLS
jgi:predicted phage terminase large subunit-like protein